MSYMHFIFWKEKTGDPVRQIGEILKSMYGRNSKCQADLILSEDRINLRIKDYMFTYSLIAENWVQEESKDIADTFGRKRNDYMIIKESRSRVEFYGDDDPDMDYFNEFIMDNVTQ